MRKTIVGVILAVFIGVSFASGPSAASAPDGRAAVEPARALDPILAPLASACAQRDDAVRRDAVRRQIAKSGVQVDLSSPREGDPSVDKRVRPARLDENSERWICMVFDGINNPTNPYQCRPGTRTFKGMTECEVSDTPNIYKLHFKMENGKPRLAFLYGIVRD